MRKNINKVPQGTPPFNVSSKTKIQNLNSTFLDGISSGNFTKHFSGVSTISFKEWNTILSINYTSFLMNIAATQGNQQIRATFFVDLGAETGNVSLINIDRFGGLEYDIKLRLWKVDSVVGSETKYTYYIDMYNPYIFGSNTEMNIVINLSFTGPLNQPSFFSKKISEYKDEYIFIKELQLGNYITANISGNAATATSLKNAIRLWGQSFNGSQNIDGSMIVNGDIVVNGKISATGGVDTVSLQDFNKLKSEVESLKSKHEIDEMKTQNLIGGGQPTGNQ